MTRIWGAFARIPVPAVAAMLVVGGALIPVHEGWVRSVHASGGPEPAQWLSYLTVKWYWALLPAAALALWARRRAFEGRLGRVGAWLAFVGGPAQFGVLLVSSVVWGLLLDRGDLPTGLMALELLGYLIPVGMALLGAAMMRDPGLPRWLGAVVVVLAVAAWLPFGGLAVGGVLAALLVTHDRRTRSVLDTPAAATAP
jgi:hypothetical protein